MNMQLPPVAGEFGLDQQGRVLEEPTGLQRIGLVLGFISALAVPAWLSFGRFAVGGGGWLTLILMMGGAVVFAVYVLIMIFVLVRVSKVRPGLPGRYTTLFLLISAALAVLVPLSYEDYGDEGLPSPSIFQTWFGVGTDITQIIFAALLSLFGIALIGAVVSAIVEQSQIAQTQRERIARLNAALSQPRPR